MWRSRGRDAGVGAGPEGKEVEPEVGGVDGIGLLGEQRAMGVVAGSRTGEGEGEKEAEEAEDGVFGDGISLGV